MDRVLEPQEAPQDWVRLHMFALALLGGVVLGVVIIDTEVARFVESASMPRLRAVFFLSVIAAGMGARALLARNTSTVDKQGWVFLIVTGLCLLAVAAYGFADCYIEVRDAYDLVMRVAEKSL